MEQKQDRHGTVEQIRAIWDKWDAIGAQEFDASHAMNLIGIVLVEEEEKERRLRTISEDARKARELVDGGE